jgi:hypothetical protein
MRAVIYLYNSKSADKRIYYYIYSLRFVFLSVKLLYCWMIFVDIVSTKYILFVETV